MKVILPIVILFLQTSCSINGITNDFKKLNEVQKSKIQKIQNFDSLDNNFIYEINARQLKNELKKHPKSLVYIFANGCNSKHCKPLNVYELYAEANDYKLFLVMNGYANLHKTFVQHCENQLFSIDSDYYDTKIRGKYTRFFQNELENIPLKDKRKEYKGGLFFFKYDSLEKILRDLPQ